MVRPIVAMQFYLGFSEVKDRFNRLQELHLTTEIAKELKFSYIPFLQKKAWIWLHKFFGQNLAIFQVWSQKNNFSTKRTLKFNPDSDNDNAGILQSVDGLTVELIFITDERLQYCILIFDD